MSPTQVHECDVWLDTDIEGVSMWQSACSCGWSGQYYDPSQHGKAVEEWETHCDAIFMEATMRRQPGGEGELRGGVGGVVVPLAGD